MDSLLMVVILGGLMLATFWLYVYVYGLYRLGRGIASRYRTKPVPSLVLIVLGSILLASPLLFLQLDFLWKCSLIFAVVITHAQAVGSGFWGRMEIGRNKDVEVFEDRTEQWLREWEEPVPKWLRDELE
jgi:hypothetical protein